MEIKTFISPDFAENTYVIYDNIKRDCIIIDPGSPFPWIQDFIKEQNLDLVSILLTHGHIDHITSVKQLKTENSNAIVYLHKSDEFLFNNTATIGRLLGVGVVQVPKIDIYLNDGDKLDFYGTSISVIHTPGHTEGSLCFLYKDILFTGDTLFQMGIGRTDLPGGSYEKIMNSIRYKIIPLGDNIKIYPGHGESTIIEQEKNHNPFLNFK